MRTLSRRRAACGQLPRTGTLSPAKRGLLRSPGTTAKSSRNGTVSAPLPLRKKNGKEHRYWNLVENRRVAGGQVIQRQVLYLGETAESR
jgi:hypothetical protein